MAVRIGDTLKQINNADFPIVEAMDVAFESGDTLQELYDSGALSNGGSGTSYIELSEEEYLALSDEQRASEVEYRTYDTGRIFKRGVEFGKETDITSKQDDLHKVKFTMRRNSVNEPRYCLIGSSDLTKTLLMNEPYRFDGTFGSNNNIEKSITSFTVSFKEGVSDPSRILRGFTNNAEGFKYVDLLITVDETENLAYAYVDFLQENSLASGEITKPFLDAESYMDFAESFELVDTYQGTLVCKMSDYCKVITEIDDVNDPSETSVWSSQKTSSKIAEVETELNAKVDKTDIATTIDLSSTDEQVASAKAVYDGLENINDFSVQVVKENLDLNDITETGIYYFSQAYTPVNIPMGVNGWLLVMKGSSSDIVKQVWYRLGTTNSNSCNTFERYKGNNTWSEWTKFLTEKEYYNALDYGNPIIPQDADLNDYLTPGVYTCMSSTIANTLLNCPHIGSNFKLIVNKNRGNDDTLFYGYQMIVGTKGGNPVTDVCVYYRGISVYNNVCVFSKWKIMSGSTVADVPETTVDLTGTDIRGSIKYMVKSGICYVSAWGVLSDTVKAAHILVKADVMPKPIISCGTVLVHGDSGLNGKLVGQLYIDYNKALSLHIYPDSVGDMGFGSFSYPVAES